MSVPLEILAIFFVVFAGMCTWFPMLKDAIKYKDKALFVLSCIMGVFIVSFILIIIDNRPIK